MRRTRKRASSCFLRSFDMCQGFFFFPLALSFRDFGTCVTSFVTSQEHEHYRDDDAHDRLAYDEACGHHECVEDL